MEAAEEGERWLRKGGWDEKLRRRECGRECEGVVKGFEEVCGGFRGKLMEMERGWEGREGLEIGVAV